MAVDRRAPNEPTPSAKNDRTDLEVWLRVKGPELLRQQAANIVLGIALIIALGFFLYSRSRNKSAEQVAVQQNAAAAYDFAVQLRGLPAISPVTGTAEGVARDRQQRAQQALSAADVVINSDAATPGQKAVAQLVKGDVAWTLANLPEGSLATTQPASGFSVKPAADYLNDAEAAYTQVLSSYTNEKESAAAALLGLAAVAENKGDFKLAGEWYQKTIDDASLRDTYRDVAKARLAMLPTLARPYVLASTQPTVTKPAGPSFPDILRRPTSEAVTTPLPIATPTTAPAAPTTAPATSAPTTNP